MPQFINVTNMKRDPSHVLASKDFKHWWNGGVWGGHGPPNFKKKKIYSLSKFYKILVSRKFFILHSGPKENFLAPPCI